MITFDKKRFGTLKSSIKRSGATLRANFQELLDMGLDFYANHADASKLTEAMEVAQETRCIPANKVKEYIKEHANVKWTGGKGEERFKKDGKGEDTPATVTEPTTTWFEFAQADKVQPDMDVVAQVKSLVTRITKAQEAGKIKADPSHDVAAIVKSLNEAVA